MPQLTQPSDAVDFDFSIDPHHCSLHYPYLSTQHSYQLRRHSSVSHHENYHSLTLRTTHCFASRSCSSNLGPSARTSFSNPSPRPLTTSLAPCHNPLPIPLLSLLFRKTTFPTLNNGQPALTPPPRNRKASSRSSRSSILMQRQREGSTSMACRRARRVKSLRS